MATVQLLEEGPRNYIIKVTGTGGDSAVNIVDVSTLAPPCEEVRLMSCTYDVAGAGGLVTVLWDATATVTAMTASTGSGQTMCFRKIGGLVNNAGAGKTGDVLLTSTAATDFTLVLHFKKVGLTTRWN